MRGPGAPQSRLGVKFVQIRGGKQRDFSTGARGSICVASFEFSYRSPKIGLTTVGAGTGVPSIAKKAAFVTVALSVILIECDARLQE